MSIDSSTQCTDPSANAKKAPFACQLNAQSSFTGPPAPTLNRSILLGVIPQLITFGGFDSLNVLRMFALQRTGFSFEAIQSVLFRSVFGVGDAGLLQFRLDTGQELLSVSIQFVQSLFLLFKRLNILFCPYQLASQALHFGRHGFVLALGHAADQ